ncbi:MAG TPA: hypothetical protein VK433_02470, partial [Stellaceae bacterium]|nr:hypothetical protein [Stellaceae bacterium]
AADAGVCALANADGIEEIHLALVGAAISDQELARRLQHALARFQLGKLYAIRVPAIPRSPAGKIERDRLKRLLMEYRGKS